MFYREKNIINSMLDYADAIQRECINSFKIETKDGRDIVTDVDKQIENFCLSLIRQNFHDDDIISEETLSKTNLPQKGRFWIIDPLDGTWNFANRIPEFALQVAFVVDGEVTLSAINIPFSISGREKYFAEKGAGAYLNEKRIYVKTQIDLKRSIIAVSDFSWEDSDLLTELNFLKSLCPNVGRIRLIGSSAISFAYLAAGRLDAYLGFDQKIWDILPGLLLVKEAGCNVYGFDGNNYRIGDKNVIAVPEKSQLKALIFNKGEIK